MKHITIFIICTMILSLLLAGSIVMSILSIMKKQTPGPQGPQGPKGERGLQGTAGKRGAAGKPASSVDNDDEQNLNQFVDNFTKVMSMMYSNASDKDSDSKQISSSKLDAAQNAFRTGLSNTFKDTDALTSVMPEVLTNSGWQSANNNEAFRNANKNIGVDCDKGLVCTVTNATNATNANLLKQHNKEHYVDAAHLNIGGNSNTATHADPNGDIVYHGRGDCGLTAFRSWDGGYFEFKQTCKGEDANGVSCKDGPRNLELCYPGAWGPFSAVTSWE